MARVMATDSKMLSFQPRMMRTETEMKMTEHMLITATKLRTRLQVDRRTTMTATDMARAMARRVSLERLLWTS